jgi:Domain of unknown function (DUF427)
VNRGIIYRVAYRIVVASLVVCLLLVVGMLLERTGFIKIVEKAIQPEDGEVVAETDRPRILFETGLPPRYHFPLRKSLRMYCTLATRKRNVPARGLRLTTRCRRAVRPGKQSPGTIRPPYPQPLA